MCYIQFYWQCLEVPKNILIVAFKHRPWQNVYSFFIIWCASLFLHHSFCYIPSLNLLHSDASICVSRKTLRKVCLSSQRNVCLCTLLAMIYIGFHDPSNLQNSISRNRNTDTRKTLISSINLSCLLRNHWRRAAFLKPRLFLQLQWDCCFLFVCFVSLLSSLLLSFPPCK